MINLAVMSSMPFERRAFVLEDGVYSMAIATDCLKSLYPGIKPNKNVKKLTAILLQFILQRKTNTSMT